MDEEALKALGQELAAADEQERAIRKNALSRRGFVRKMAIVASVGAAALMQQSANAGVCGTNTAGCTGANTCNVNTCNPATVNTCKPNECLAGNTCGSSASANTCTGNTCDAKNTCDFYGNTCATANTCSPNTCYLGNKCTGSDTTCPSGNLSLK